jgi:predicted RNA-binding protein YlqC (UPF0109 family)
LRKGLPDKAGLLKILVGFMAKKTSRIAATLKQLGEVQVNDWDFMALLNKDVREIELGHSLRRLGNVRVMEWDFRTVLPVVNKLAHQEVDVVGFMKRTAHYKVMEWDFRTALHGQPEEIKQVAGSVSGAEMQLLMLRLKNFLEYVALGLIDDPLHSQIKVQQIAKDVLRYKLVLAKRDVIQVIGRDGHTAAAIRSILKAVAAEKGVHVLLLIHSHEEEVALLSNEQRPEW